MERNILITGASTGIGYTTALMLATGKGCKANYQVFGTVRSNADAAKLSHDSDGKITPILMDVTNDDAVTNGFKELSTYLEGEGLYGLINNAGIVVGGPVECLPIARLEEQMAVNVFGLIRVTQQAIPLLRQFTKNHQRAHIANISSIAGLSPLPFVSPYSMSKHCVESMSDALRVELAPWHIEVNLIEPGAVKTPIWEKSLTRARNITGDVDAEKIKLYEKPLEKVAELSQKSGKRGVEPEVVTAAIIHALESNNPKTRYLLGKDAKLRKLSRKLPDRLQDWVIRKKLGI